MKRKLLLLAIIIVFSLLLVFYLLFYKEDKLISDGNLIVEKIEAYRKSNNRLPNSLTDVGIVLKDEDSPPLYYEKKDSSNYIVYFGTSLGESKIYFSDSKAWENFNRPMKR